MRSCNCEQKYRIRAFVRKLPKIEGELQNWTTQGSSPAWALIKFFAMLREEAPQWEVLWARVYNYLDLREIPLLKYPREQNHTPSKGRQTT